MSVTYVINNTGYPFPQTGDEGWGDSVTAWAGAVSTGLLQKSGGAFTLTAEVDFGANYGLKATYFKGRGSNQATSGQYRLAVGEKIAWRNNANSANLDLIPDASDNLTYNGAIIATASGVLPVSAGGTGFSSYTIGDTLYASATAAFSKLAIGAANTVLVSTGTAPSWAQIVNANVSNSAAIAYSKLNLTGSIVNADVSASAAIARTKLASGSNNHVLINDGSGVMSSEASLATTRGGTGLTSYTTGDTLYASGSNTLAKLGIGSTGQVVTVSGGVPTWQNATGQSYNFLLNGRFDIWQYGTSTTVGNGSSLYQCDRWYVANTLGTNGVITYSRQTSSYSGADLYALKVQITTAPTAGQQNGTALYQTLDNLTSLGLYNQTASFSVQVKAFGNVNQVGVQFMYRTSEAKVDTTIGSEQVFTVNTSTYTACTISGQALGTSMTSSGVVGVRIRIVSASTGNSYDLNNGFQVEQAMLNIGAVPAGFVTQTQSSAAELSRCERFYEKSYDQATAPGTSNTGPGGQGFRSSLTGTMLYTTTFKVSKRISNNSVTVYSTGTGTAGKCRDRSAGTDLDATPVQTGENAFETSISSAVAANSLAFQWICNAEI